MSAWVVCTPYGEHLVQQHAARIDVRGRADGLARNLLGGCIVWREKTRARFRCGRLVDAAVVEELRDAESSSFTSPSWVTRMLVGLRSRWTISRAWACATARATGGTGPARSNGQLLFPHVLVDRPSGDVLHREPWLPGRGDAGVVQAGNVEVGEGGEDLTFLGHPFRGSTPRDRPAAA